MLRPGNASASAQNPGLTTANLQASSSQPARFHDRDKSRSWQSGWGGVVVVCLGEFADAGRLTGGHGSDDVLDATAVDRREPT